MKSVLCRVVKHLSLIRDARCLKVKAHLAFGMLNSSHTFPKRIDNWREKNGKVKVWLHSFVNLGKYMHVFYLLRMFYC